MSFPADTRERIRARFDGEPEVGQKSGPKTIRATPFRWRDPATIPPRRWLYGHHLIRGFVSATIAPGGMGKSSQSIGEALAMVTGRQIMGDKPAGQLRVWYWNGEDPAEETQRRVAAACLQFGIHENEIGDRLFLDSGRDLEIQVASDIRGTATINTKTMAAVLEAVREDRIDVVLVDPFAASHGVSENDNGAINMVVRQWAMLAETADCAVELIHHARKASGGQFAYTVEDARGASALVAATRSARVLNIMTEDESDRAGIRNRRAFFRVDNGKANLAPPPDRSQWRQLVGVPLGNGDYATGQAEDHVAVAVPWEWPQAGTDTYANLERRAHEKRAEDAFIAALKATIAEGRGVSHSTNAKNYAPRMLGERAETDGLSRRDLELAMERLFQAGRIKANETVGVKSNRHPIIGIKPVESNDQQPEN